MPEKNAVRDNFFSENQPEQKDNNINSSNRIWSSTGQLFELLKIDSLQRNNPQEISFQHIRYKKGQKICAAGAKSHHFYVVHTGFLKSS